MEEFAILLLRNFLTIVLLVLIFLKKGSTNREKIWWIAILLANLFITYYIYDNGEFVCENRTTFEYFNTLFRILFFLLLFKSVIQNRTI
jgi:predicted membrane protein